MEGLDKFVEDQFLKHYPTPESALDEEIHLLRLAIKKSTTKQLYIKKEISNAAIEMFKKHGLILTSISPTSGWFGYQFSFASQRDRSPSREKKTPEKAPSQEKNSLEKAIQKLER